MKEIGNTLGRILGLVFAALIIVYTSMLTLQLAQRLVPGNAVSQYMTLILFDGAALVWFIQFITQAKGTMQWAAAGLGFLVGLIGSITMAAGELILGQNLVTVDDPTRLGWVLVSTVIVAALAHATLVYLFHFADPVVKNRIENAQKVGSAIEAAYADARSEIDRQREVLTRKIVDTVIFDAMEQFDAVSAAHIRNGNAIARKTITAQVRDAEETEKVERLADPTSEPVPASARIWPPFQRRSFSIGPKSLKFGGNGNARYNAETTAAGVAVAEEESAVKPGTNVDWKVGKVWPEDIQTDDDSQDPGNPTTPPGEQ